MDSRTGQAPSIEATFHGFPQLPFEIQLEIFKLAAIEWICDGNSCGRVTYHHFGTHVEVCKTKLYALPHEDDEMNTDPSRMTWKEKDSIEAEEIVAYNAALALMSVLPELFFVNTLARGVMYNFLTRHRPNSAPPAEENEHLYCEDDTRFCGDASDFGVCIQDFRRPGLEDRVIEEYERLDESYQQFMETTGRAEKKERSKGFFMLPGNENFVHASRPPCGFASVLQNYLPGEEHGFFELEERMQNEWEEYERIRMKQ